MPGGSGITRRIRRFALECFASLLSIVTIVPLQMRTDFDSKPSRGELDHGRASGSHSPPVSSLEGQVEALDHAWSC